MTPWIVTNIWYRNWRKFVNLMNDPALSPSERHMYARAATLANASYVMALAVENKR